MKQLIKKAIKRLILLFVPKKLRDKIKQKIFNYADSHRPKEKESLPYIISSYYGKIYMPYYPYSNFFENNKPHLYNSEGKLLELWFLRDRIGAHVPYASSKYFAWDHFNISLPVHFYTHGTILETMGKPSHRYAYFVESESIIPDEYAIFETHKGIEKDFDAVFTYSEKLLNSLPNAKFFPSCASMWYGIESFEGVPDSTVLDERIYLKKTKNISMVCSEKKYTPMHFIRHRFASDALASRAVDVFGKFNGGKWMPYKSMSLKDYRFQIVVENDIAPFYFTEKIIDCFAAMTIPVYLGAEKISDFFNEDGIVKIEKDSSIESILKICTKEYYEEHLKAVQENFQRVLKYKDSGDLLYETFFLK